MQVDLSAAARESARQLTDWRRHLHANPELSFQEVETTAWLTALLTGWGIPCSHPTPTGVVGLIEGNRPGKTIALRADIDALPITEENTFPFRSTRAGVMHACGHDGHTAILLGLARYFSRHRDFAGRINLLFQPAEELPPGGAKAFVEAGVLDGVDGCLGLHLISEIPTGRVSICDGPMMANSDGFSARILGRGGHGASPHQTVDAVMVACNAVVNLQTVVSRKVDPTKPAVLSIGAIHAGTTFNVIADAAEIKGTVRSFHTDVRQQLHDEINRTLQSTCDMYGARYELAYNWGYPALVNQPEMANLLRAAARATLGEMAVLQQTPIMGGEDFAYYAAQVPAAFLFVGCRNKDADAVWEHHHPRFTIDEAALPIGMEILGRAAIALLGEH